MKRLAFLLALLGLAACRDQLPVDPGLDPGRPAFDTGGCTGDFHFGDNCTSADGSEGSHYRLAHISWSDVGNNTAEFTYTLALRSSFYGTVAVGDQRQFANINLGDGTSTQPTFTVTFVDAASDWFIAQAKFTHPYGGAGPYTAYSRDCCRIGTTTTPGWTHINNPDDYVRIETTVNFASAGSPETSLPAIVSCGPDQVCSFRVAAVAPNRQAIQWRLATPAEMGGETLDHPPGASIDATTGTYSWNTTGATLGGSDSRTVYSTQVVMETVSGSTVTSKSAIDFLIELTSAANASPQFTGSTPADGHVFTVAPNQTLDFSVSASDADANDLVTLGILNAPAGASFPVPAASNPVSTTFSWTPGTADAGTSHVINLLAQDGRGGSTSRSITIAVEQPTGTITGLVTDSESLTQAPLAGVQVSVLNTTLSALTDANGTYTIANVPAGTHTVQAAKQYFETGSQTGITVVDGGIATASFALVATHRAVTVNLSEDTRCDMTVTARSITTDAFFAQRASPEASSTSQCPASATFILPARLKFVFGLHNEIVSDAEDHKVWPNFRPLPADDGLPNRVGAVCVESNGSCTNAPLTPDNVYAAIAAATPLVSDRNISLGFHVPPEPVVPCTLTGASYPARVHVISALDPSRLGTMPRNDFYPPGIGHFVDAVNSDAAGECEIKSVPAGHTVVIEAQDADGDVYRAVLTPGETSLVMEEDPDYFYAYYLLDGYGDNLSGKDDVTLVTFGTNRNADGTQGNTLLVKADSRAIQENGTAQFHIEVKDARDASGAVIAPSILAKVICSKQKGTCEIAEVTGDQARFLGVTGYLDSAGDGWVTVQFDVSGAVSAEVMVRVGVADGYDFAPESGSNAAAPALPEIRNGYAVWRRTTLPGSSYDVAYP